MVTFTVQADTEEEASRERERLCAALGLQPVGRPIDPSGRGRWMARAEKATALPGGGSGRASSAT